MARVCTNCSTVSNSDKTFCEECGTPFAFQQSATAGAPRAASTSPGMIVLAWMPFAVLALRTLLGHAVGWSTDVKHVLGLRIDWYDGAEILWYLSDSLGLLGVSLAVAITATVRKAVN